VTSQGGFSAIMAPAFSPWAAYAAERNMAFFAIEALAGVKRSGGLPTRGDAWRVARRLRRRLAGLEPSWRAERSAEDALGAALAEPGVTSVLITTTRLAHLDACLAAASSAA
jgi:aryl-alcohol dehydrogenase-like predicted oxidoreductase